MFGDFTGRAEDAGADGVANGDGETKPDTEDAQQTVAVARRR